MTEQPQLHDLTKFILSRLESYPEEFFFSNTGPESKKWATSLSAIKYCGTPEDIAAINKAYMDRVLQNALEVLLAPEEPTVGQSPVGVSFGVSGIGRNGGSGNVGPSLTQQQAQAIMNAQPNSVTISPNVARAMGLKPPTVNETFVEAYERIKKRLGL